MTCCAHVNTAAKPGASVAGVVMVRGAHTFDVAHDAFTTNLAEAGARAADSRGGRSIGFKITHQQCQTISEVWTCID